MVYHKGTVADSIFFHDPGMRYGMSAMADGRMPDPKIQFHGMVDSSCWTMLYISFLSAMMGWTNTGMCDGKADPMLFLVDTSLSIT